MEQQRVNVVDLFYKVHIVFEELTFKLLVIFTDLVLNVFSLLQQIKHVLLCYRVTVQLIYAQFELMQLYQPLLTIG